MSDNSLYRYLPDIHARSMLECGELLFSNLTRFKQMEHEARGDVLEGCHVDNPDNDVTFTNLTTGRTFSGPFSFRNSVRDEKGFVYCTAREFDEGLYRAFNADRCVEIINVGAFVQRVRAAVRRLNFIDPVGLLHGPVTYFRPNAPCEVDVSVGANIPFLKHSDFSDQNEYRFAFARKGALKTLRRLIVNRDWNTEPDHLKGVGRTLLLTVGPLKDICRLHHAEAPEMLE